MKLRYPLTALLGALIGAGSTLPLSWVTGDHLTGLDPDVAALGTVWDGSIAHIDGLPPILTRLSGTTLLASADGPQLKLQASATTNTVSDVTLSLPIRSLSRFDPRLAGLGGDLRLTLDTLTYDATGCTSATGQAASDILAVNRSTWNWQGPRLSGPISCEDGNVLVTLAGREAAQAVSARISISPAGPYRTDITLDTADENAALVLPLFGFERAGASWRLSESGAWQ